MDTCDRAAFPMRDDEGEEVEEEHDGDGADLRDHHERTRGRGNEDTPAFPHDAGSMVEVDKGSWA